MNSKSLSDLRNATKSAFSWLLRLSGFKKELLFIWFFHFICSSEWWFVLTLEYLLQSGNEASCVWQYSQFPSSDYMEDLEEIMSMTKEDVVSMLRRGSTGFSRGASRFRGVTKCDNTGDPLSSPVLILMRIYVRNVSSEDSFVFILCFRHHMHGKWESRIGRVHGNRYLVRTEDLAGSLT